MDMNNPIIAVVVTLVAVGFLIYRQVRPRRLSERGLVVMPLIVLYFILQAFPSFHPTSIKLVEVGISIAVSVVFGFLACRQLKVYASPSTGKAMASGSWVYFLWWLGAFIVKALLSVGFGETSASGVNQVEILIPVFFLIVTRNLYLFWRVNQLGLELHSHRK